MVTHQFLPDRFDLTGLHIVAGVRFKVAHVVKRCALLTVRHLDAGEQVVFLFLDLLEIILLGEKRNPSCIRANDVRAIRILVRNFEQEGHRVSDFQVGQNFAVIPIDRLFTASVLERSLEGYRFLLTQVHAIGDHRGADIMIIAGTHGKVQLTPKEGVEVRFRRD